MHESFLAYRNFRYLKLSLGLVALTLLAYLLDPSDPANGGTWLGYTLGTIGALLIVWLLWFGVRKRQYNSRLGNVADWLSGHVYLGASLLVVATLHSGFQFGWNVHTLSYALMVLVILSGFYGVFAYWRFPAALTQNRSGMSSDAMLSEIAELDQQCLEIADQLGSNCHQIVLRSIERTTFTRRALRGTPKKLEVALDTAVGDLTRLSSDPGVTLWRPPPAVGPVAAQANDLYTQLWVAEKRVRAKSSDGMEQLRRLQDLITSKKALVTRVQRDLRHHALLKTWLYLHVPVSIALLAALTVHIVSVFLYW
jgi:hypothetical protein